MQTDTFSGDAPIVEIWRGDILESVHRGQVAVVDSAGSLLLYYGSPNQQVTLRSSAKPFQGISLLESGAADAFGFDDAEIALCCGSHDGEDMHVETCRSILLRAGLNEDALRCGAHWPLDRQAQLAAKQKMQEPVAAFNNCSGKHSGMLASAVHLREGTADYEHPDHPVQQRIKQVVQQFTECEDNELQIACDGCGVPTFAMPLWRIALGFARLADPESLPVSDAQRLKSCRRVTASMVAFPEMVGGTKGNFDTECMRLANGRLVAKAGAEGLACAAVFPHAQKTDRGIGIAVKITDGDLRNIRSVPLLGVLHSIGVLDTGDLQKLRCFYERPLCNHRGEEIGQVKLAMRLVHP